MKFTAVGDALIQRRIPADYPGFAGVREWLERAQVRYFNLETTVFRETEGLWGSSLNGGSYLLTEILGDTESLPLILGFYMVSLALTVLSAYLLLRPAQQPEEG